MGRGRVGILVGGGPAPGINSVIASATIQCRLADLPVLGIRDGFHWLIKERDDQVVPLEIADVSRIHFRGGSYLRTSRANPTKQEADLDRVVRTLSRLNVDRLITIGGDDTAYSAMKVAEQAAGWIKVVHVPKTIDNDLSLPPTIDTFGFQTARHLGVQVVKNLMEDASTTSRWYFAVAMGRKAGHLALGIGKAAGAHLTLIPEDFQSETIRLATIVDTLVGSIVKRIADGNPNGVAVVAEGVVLGIDPSEFAELENVERDEHGHVRLAEIEIGALLRREVRRRLKRFGVGVTVVDKNIGYELRCADPIPFDMEYTRDLGYCAARFLLEGGSGAMVTMQGGSFVPVPFAELLDPDTGRTRVRMVDARSTGYKIAQAYMFRLRQEDFGAPLPRLAAVCGLKPDEFRAEFGHVVEARVPAESAEGLAAAGA